MKSIRSWSYVLALLVCLAGIVLSVWKPRTDLGNGFSTEGTRPFASIASHNARRQLWLTAADGTRMQLSEAPVGRQAILRTNSIVIWQESRVVGHGAFEAIYSNYLFAADTTGRRAELTGWLSERAERVLPTAPVESLPAYLGSDTTPNPPPANDPRNGVHSFKPNSVQLAHWRPGITIWCDVPCNGSSRPLAMEVPLAEVAALLRQQPVVAAR